MGLSRTHSYRGSEGRGGGQLYASVQRATDRAGKNGKARRREGGVYTFPGWNGGDMIFQFGQKMKRTSVSFFTETIINRDVMEIIWLPKYLPLIL